MTPMYCHYHDHWTDGQCVAGYRSLTRQQVLLRINDIDNQLSDDEDSQSRGYRRNQALRFERNMLNELRESGAL